MSRSNEQESKLSALDRWYRGRLFQWHGISGESKPVTGGSRRESSQRLLLLKGGESGLE